MENNALVQVTTSDDICLQGYYSPSQSEKCVLYIHGYESNFYDNYFIFSMENMFEEEGVGLLAANTRGAGKDTDFVTSDGNYKRIGSRYELLEEAHLDITAWVNFLVSAGKDEIILMGHSLGTIKVTRYLFEGEYKDQINKLVLLAPFDRKGLLKGVFKKDVSELLELAKGMVDNGNGSKLKPRSFGVNNVSYKTIQSWYKQDDLGRMFEFCSKDYDFPILRQIEIPTLILVGSDDLYFHQSNPGHPEEAMEILLSNISNAKGKIIEDATHSFRSYENIISREVLDFILNK